MEFETQLREKEKEKELLEEKISRQDQDVSSYLQLMEVKDESIVKLSNKLDELEIAAKIDKAATPPIVGAYESQCHWSTIDHVLPFIQQMEVVTSQHTSKRLR